jgi:outer membrane usher protein FimD/PapC
MVSGTFGENNKYNYNMAASHDNYSGTSTTMGLGWQGSAATMNGSYSQEEIIRAPPEHEWRSRSAFWRSDAFAI